MKQVETKKLDYISTLNVLSCFSVIVLHCNGEFWNRPEGRLWITCNFLESFFYFAVPIFFMISGVTLLDYNERYSTKEYFKKRIKKVVVPFFIWSIIGFLYAAKGTIQNGGEVDLNIIHIIDNIMNCRYMSVYCFFPPLFAVYLSIPVLAQIADKEKTYLYMTYLGIVFIVILPLIASLFSMGYNVAFKPCIMSGYILYPIVGYLLQKNEIDPKKRRGIYLLGIIGWATQFVGTIALSGPGEINDTFKGYLNLPTFLQSCAVFVVIKYHTPHSEVVTKIIKWLAKRTFGVYLIHMYLLQEISSVLQINTESIVWRTVGASVIFLISAGIVWIIQRIPVLKHVTP